MRQHILLIHPMVSRLSESSLILWNCQSVREKFSLIQAMITTPPSGMAPPPLFALTETWLTPEIKLTVPLDYIWSCLHSPIKVSPDRTITPRGGLALVHHNTVPAVLLNSYSKHFDLAPPGAPIPKGHSPTAAILWHQVRLPQHSPSST